MDTVQVDVAVVGAGPAGLNAAHAALAGGARVGLVDAEARLGGQFWRHGPGGLGRSRHQAGDYHRLAAGLADGMASGSLAYLASHRVWRVEPVADRWVLRCLRASAGGGDREVVVTARVLLLAPGAHDRVLPFPGWDLPGVLTAGAAQSLLKEHGVPAGRRVVVAGTGPFLLPVAADLAAAGAEVVAVLEAGSGRGLLRRWGAGWHAYATAGPRLAEAAGYLAVLARHGVPVRTGAAVVAAHGDGAVTAVSVARVDEGWHCIEGSTRRLECDAVAVSWGFVPRLELAQQAGCDLVAGPDGAAVVSADEVGVTSVPGVLAAGEATGVGGAALAAVEGRLAGSAAAALAAGHRPRADPRQAGHRQRLREFAAALHAAHPVRDGWLTWLDDDTVVCRCEEVPLARVVEAVDQLGATDARTAKLLTRCGMGWCQGRMCAEAVSRLVAVRGSGAGMPANAADHRFSQRPIASPVSLRTLARAHPCDLPTDPGRLPEGPS